MSSEPDVSFTPAGAPAPGSVAVYGRGHRAAVAACGWPLGLAAGSITGAVLAGAVADPSFGGLIVGLGHRLGRGRPLPRRPGRWLDGAIPPAQRLNRRRP